jgi:hypothetical protein
MGARKKEHVAPQLPHSGDDAVGTGGDLGDAFASRAAVLKDLPAWPFGANVRRCPPLVLAVIPFDKIVVDGGTCSEAGQLARPPRPLQGAGKNMVEREARSPRSVSGRSVSPVCCPERLHSVSP